MNARQRSQAETRRRLLEQGLKLFASQGVAETRTADIAEGAGVAVGTLYLHFKDKQGLLRAVLFEGVEQLMAELHKLAEEPLPDIGEYVLRHTELMVRFAQTHRDMCRVLFDPEAVRCRISTEITDMFVLFQERRLCGQAEAGLLAPGIGPKVAAHAVVGLLTHTLEWWIRHPEEVDAGTVISTLVNLRLSGLYAAGGGAA
ncbi:MAG: TetR/AcrR family transcriptional regulator [Candidatus Hydrogenedens sp.]|nr:TetR/AcrR family transcriptional regulator [Candidatus Hydrogenedentota bacterium]NLF57852.1 TetR/AcrR family transcriptional regulator [Candidatus Hydrogenedens sp.]